MPALPLRTLSIALALAAPAGGAIAIRHSKDGGASGTIQACAARKDGRVRVVSRAGDCRRQERAISWSVRGPKGEAGPAGSAGPRGAAGAAGPSGQTGAAGAAGPQGAAGRQGDRGPQGPAGPKGEPGTSITALEALDGLPCHAGGHSGKVALTYDASGKAVFTCVLHTADSAVRINEFATGTSTAATDEFVELVNPGASPADLGGFRLVYRSGAGTADVVLGTVPAGTTLAPGAFYLFGGSGYAGVRAADQSFTAGLAATAGGLGLRDAEGGLVDSVGYGSATNGLVESHAAAAPPTTATPGSSDARVPDGHDTNDNAADFSVMATPTPGGRN
ncbi:MAG: lamin tail domain-containing protein [Actinomycetota bacterium]|nr:lamin tail domain-containing protein [Actinomycetota bacterium]